MLNRRSLITGLISFVAAPAIVKASSLMPVKVWAEPIAINKIPKLYPYQLDAIRFILDSDPSYSYANIGEVWVPYTVEKAVEEMILYGRVLTKTIMNEKEFNAIYPPFPDISGRTD